nr:integrase, catalytic region, zinc finger, CCHC-type, peptidase aspartic, catalytic [Tanacetum cinerariifolium]
MNIGQDRQMHMVRGCLKFSSKSRCSECWKLEWAYCCFGIANQNTNQNENGNVVAAQDEGNGNGNNENQVRCYNCRRIGHLARNYIVRPRRRDVAYLQTQLLIAQKEEVGIQLQAEEFDLMAATGDLDEIEKVNTNNILMANLRQASTSGTQTDKALVYDSYGSTENDSNVISAVYSMEQSRGRVEQHPATVEKKHTYFESLYFKSLAKEDDEYLAKHKSLEYEIKRLLRAVVSQDIMSIVQSNYVVDTSNLQTELDRTKEKLETCITKKEKEYVVLCNNWYKNAKNANMTRFRMIKLIMTCKTKLNGCKLNWEISRERVLNYAKENAHLKTTYKNLFDSIKVTSAQTKTITDSLQDKLHDTIYENAMLRAQLFYKVFEQTATTKGTSTNTKFANKSTFGTKLYSVTLLPKLWVLLKVVESNDLSNPVTSNSIPTTKESKVVKNDKVIALRMFRINPFKNSRVENVVPSKPVKASVRTNPITVSQANVITKQDVNSNSNGLSSTGVDNTVKTRRPQPRGNTKNNRVPSAFKSSCIKNKEVKVEKHHRNLLLSKNKKNMSSKCNSIKISIRNDRSEVICAMCKQCLITANHDVCVLEYVNDINYRGDKLSANVSKITNQKEHKLKVKKPKKFPEAVHFGNDHIALILGCGDLQWGKILITRVYFVKGLGHNLFSVGQFCDLDLEVAFRRNTCFVRNLEGVDLLKGNHTTNLYTINLHEMASAYPICRIARITSTKSWLWHQRLSHLNFDTINDLAKNDLAIDIGKLGAKGDIGFFISYFANSCSYRVYNQRTKKIMDTMNVTFDELSAMAFEQHGEMCIYALTVSTIEPRNVKEAMTDPAWIDSMQEELLQFKRLDNHFNKGTIDPTLFIRRFDDDILVVQVYVDDIIFGFTNPRQKAGRLVLEETRLYDTVNRESRIYVSIRLLCPSLWMWTQLTDYAFHFNKIPIYRDSKSAIAIY